MKLITCDNKFEFIIENNEYRLHKTSNKSTQILIVDTEEDAENYINWYNRNCGKVGSN
jgi:hypothetical protein